MGMELPSWPPEATEEQEAVLISEAADYALANGLVLRPPPAVPAAGPSTSAVIHAPVSLYPSPYFRHCFELASRLQPIYNTLYANVASSPSFIHRVIGGSVARVDDFTGQLYSIYREVERDSGHRRHGHLGLFRSDYLLHREDDRWGIRQVEFNTISSSFGPLSDKVSEMHKCLAMTAKYNASISPLSLPANRATAALAGGLAAAHKSFGTPVSRTKSPASVLFVVQPRERNAFDQRLLEYELMQTHRVSSVRLTFAELETCSSCNQNGDLFVSFAGAPVPVPISVVYFRAGYTPTDYPTEAAWKTRLLLERSSAINCPSVSLQLAGAKKVQQALADPGELERFVSAGALTQADADLIRKSWTDMYPLDDSPRGLEGYRLATNPATACNFVLKPQREGGGNNIYGLKIPPALLAMAAEDEARLANGEPRAREAYILMSMIRPPENRRAVLVRANAVATGSEAVQSDVVSELGMYGVVLYRQRLEGEGAEVVANVGDAGHLLRTKASAAEEGGVAVGISCLDSPLLV